MWLRDILQMNQWAIKACSQPWKCIHLELRDIEVRDDTGKMCAPVWSVAILLSCLFWQSGAFVLNGAIRQYGHNCQPPTTAATGDVSSLLHHNENTSPAFCLHIWMRCGSNSILSPVRAELRIYIISFPVEKEEDKNLLRHRGCKKNIDITWNRLTLHNQIPTLFSIISSFKEVVRDSV